jgi:enoyl-CoA hydratase
LAAHEAWVNSAFAGKDLATIMDAVTQASTSSNPDHAAWASASLDAMNQGSPLMLHVTLKAIRAANALTLPQALSAERQLMKRCFAHGEPIEGIRALAVDKDHSPKWSHANWADVSAAQVTALFA